MELGFVQHPVFEPAFLYGAMPNDDLMHKFLMAEKSNAESLSESVLPDGVRMIDLPGHSFSMVGFLSEDKTFYCADAICSKSALDKYGICYIYDVAAYLETLEKLKGFDASIFVPSHAEVTDDISPIADYNRDKVMETADLILSLSKDGAVFDDILKGVFDFYSLRMTSEQYVLVSSTVRSFLTYLRKKGLMSAEAAGNRMVYQRS